MKPVMKVKAKELSGGFSYEGLVELPNLCPTLLRKDRGGTVYATVSNLRQAAQAAAKKYKADLVFVEPNKVAAKKSSK